MTGTSATALASREPAGAGTRPGRARGAPGVRSATRIAVEAAPGRARCALAGGVLAPRLIGADPTGARIALVAAGALLLGGDEVRLEVDVGPGARLEVVETAGTVAYPGPPARWTVHARVAAGGLLLWEGLPFVVADGARVARTTALALDDGARAVLRETLVLGRAGEAGGVLAARTDVLLGGRELLVEDLDLAPGRREAPGVLGPFRVLDAVAAFGFRPEGEPARRAGAAGWSGRFDLAGPGAVGRHLGREAHSVTLAATYAEWAEQAQR